MQIKYLWPTITALVLAALALTAAAPNTGFSAPLAAAQSLLYDQTSAPDPLSLAFTSQNWAGQVSEIADDFEIPDDHPNRFWLITSLVVHYKLETAVTSLRVRFYTDFYSSTVGVYLPSATPVYSGTYPITGKTFDAGSKIGLITVTLTSPVVVLTPGRYWVSAQSPLTGNEYQFLWQVNGIGDNTAPSAFRGYSSYSDKCLNGWGRRVADCSIGTGRPEDMRFQLYGQTGIFTNWIFKPIIRR